MSWKKHFTVYKGVEQTQTRSSTQDSTNKFQSWLPEVYTGQLNRVDRYAQYDQMDMDSEVNAALDTIAEFCTQSDDEVGNPFKIVYKDTPSETESKILETTLRQWCNLNDWDKRMFKTFRNTIKYGDQPFIRDPETWVMHYVNPQHVSKVVVNEHEGKKPEQYVIKDININLQNLSVATKTNTDFAANPATGMGGTGGGGAGGSTGNGTAGSANTGGGGGGSPSAYIGGGGGSGIIIIGTGSASTYDSMTDVPTLTSTTAANYCVMNPLRIQNVNIAAGTLSDGNLKITTSASDDAYSNHYGTMAFPTTGKWYFETVFAGAFGNDAGNYAGITGVSNGSAACTIVVTSSTAIQKNFSNVQTGLTFSAGDILGVAFNATNLTVDFYKNGSAFGSQVTGLDSVE